MKKAEPTFEEFLYYLTKTPIKDYNYHWKPASLFCSPCQIQYDVIVKMESFREDSQYLIQSAGLGNTIKVEWYNYKGTDDEIRKKYYSKIPKETLKKVYEKFKWDFKMFQYDPNEYYKFANG